MTPFPPEWVPFRVNLWIAARLLPLYAKRGSLGDLLALATPTPGTLDEAGDVSAIVAAVKETTARPWRMRGRRCLREGLLAFHYLSRSGKAPLLHFGVDRSSLRGERTKAHCWVSVGGETVLNAPKNQLHELFVYDGRQSTPVGTLTLAEVSDNG